MQQEQKILRRMAVFLFVGYLTAVVLFYFLAGEQLHLRESRGNISLLPAESGTIELTAGSVVEQQFITTVQRLEQVSVQWGTYYRQNAGTVVMELWDLQSNHLLLSQTFDAASIAEGGLTTLAAEKPMEGLYHLPLALRITSPDSQPGSALSPLMNLQGKLEEAGGLFFNGSQTEGTL